MKSKTLFSSILLFLALLSCRPRNEENTEVKNVKTKVDEYMLGVTSTDLLEFDAGLRPKVAKEVDSKIYYRIYTVPEKRRFDVCYLQHGHGIDSNVLKYLVSHYFGEIGYDLFWKVYFGDSTTSKLMKQACQRVVIAMQESSDTSVLELTERTEIFLRDKICVLGALGSCAIIGHSKGGAVVTNIARRCMQKTSLMEDTGCARLGKVYSSTGITGGTLLAVLAHGITMEDPNTSTNKSVLDGIRQVFSFNYLMKSVMGAAWNLEPYVEGETNPMWWDLSPTVPMENGLSIYETNDIALTKTGWLTADYYATGSTTDFSKGEVAGCGSALAGWNIKHAALCAVLVQMIPKFQDRRLNAAFERGKSGLLSRVDAKKEPKLFKFLSNATFADFQKGDGLVNNSSLLLTCRNSLASSRLPNGAARSCYEHNKLNHLATTGGAKEVTDHMVSSLMD